MKNKNLENFIKEFIPKGVRFTKSKTIHIETITNTINRTFKKYYNIDEKFEPEFIAKAFVNLDYKFFENDQYWTTNKPFRLRKSIWINVSHNDMHLLYHALKKADKNMGNDKKEAVDKLIERLKKFELEISTN